MQRRTWIVLGWLAVAAAHASEPPPVAAQTASDRDRARVEFDAGMAAARAGDWGTAHDRFTAAYALAPLPGILMNLAGAQRQTGRFVEAASSYRRWLEEVTPASRDARHRPTVEQELAEVLASTPRLRIAVTGRLAGDVVQADGRVVAPDQGPIAVDPGHHRVTLVRDGAVVVETEVDVAAGSTAAVALAAPPPRVATPVEVAVATVPPPVVTPPIEAPAPPPASDDTTTWIVVGSVGGAVVVAGAILGAVLASSGSPAAFQGNFGPGTVRIP